MTQQDALNILKTGANVFLTGEPGSGKTHTVNRYVAYLKAAKIGVAITASTGIAATHISGMTIHSWSGIGITKKISKYDADRIASNERIVKRMKKSRVLVIDEISMLDGETLGSVDRVCRAVHGKNEAFGGMQVVFVGDFFQLPPVSRYGESPAEFAFVSSAWASAKPVVCYLSEQHRQADTVLLELLSALRSGTIAPSHREHLNMRSVSVPENITNSVTKLFSHNADVDRINTQALNKINSAEEKFHMKSSGQKHLVEQLQKGCLSPKDLVLKKGAIVMFTKNSTTGGFVNGTLGQVIGFESIGRPYPIVKTKQGRKITAEPMDWMIEDNGVAIARISQIPLRLAWAMTVHKSQGMSLDAAFVDLRSAFVEGQGYVALSRVRTLDGLFLAGYNEQALTVHPTVLAYDEQFRKSSDSLASEFKALSEEELQKMHRNFLNVMKKL